MAEREAYNTVAYTIMEHASKTVRIHAMQASCGRATLAQTLTVYFFLPFFFELPWLTIGVAASAGMPGIGPCRPG